MPPTTASCGPPGLSTTAVLAMQICVKACPKEVAIVVENFLASKINYDICIGCGMCPRLSPSADHVDGVVRPETQEARGAQARSGPPAA